MRVGALDLNVFAVNGLKLNGKQDNYLHKSFTEYGLIRLFSELEKGSQLECM